MVENSVGCVLGAGVGLTVGLAMGEVVGVMVGRGVGVGVGVGAGVGPVLSGAGLNSPSTTVKVYATAQRRSPLRFFRSNSSATIVWVPIVAVHGTYSRFWRALSPSSDHGAAFSVAVMVTLSR